MNVLSLFDGISCGRVALYKNKINVSTYYSSEINKNAIKISSYHFPTIKQLGDINDWKEWNIYEPDLIIGGSPCQGFSQEGKMLNFSDPRSRLFFTFVDILKFYKPKYFLLENVFMKKEWQDIISDNLEVSPITINSNLFSAQNRKRLYWTNIPIDMNIVDKKLVFKDIEDHNEQNYKYWSDDQMKKFYNKEYVRKDYYKVVDRNEKVGCLMAQFGHNEPKTWHNNRLRKLTRLEWERLQTVPDGYTDQVSVKQAKECLGNGWTVDVIAHIFKGLINDR